MLLMMVGKNVVKVRDCVFSDIGGGAADCDRGCDDALRPDQAVKNLHGPGGGGATRPTGGGAVIQLAMSRPRASP